MFSAQLVEPGPRLTDRGGRVPQQRHHIRYPLDQLPQRRFSLRGNGFRLGCGVGHCGELVGEQRGPLPGEGGTAVCLPADFLVEAGAEQLQQDLPPVGTLGAQEFGEFTLREHHALTEVVEIQPEQFLHRGGHRTVGRDHIGQRR